MNTWPPWPFLLPAVEAEPVVLPAITVTTPPSSEAPSPTLMLMEPPLPLAAVPVPTRSSPLLPELVVPLLNIRKPAPVIVVSANECVDDAGAHPCSVGTAGAIGLLDGPQLVGEADRAAQPGGLAGQAEFVLHLGAAEGLGRGALGQTQPILAL